MRSRLLLLRLLLLGTLLLATPAARPARAQEESPAPRRPRVGLALGGGAARGLAHVGVLEWLEENRIPVDYIAGTSMGGLVAGVYATGLSAGEMRAFLQDVDWARAFSGEPPYGARSFRRKQDRRQYPTALEIGLGNGVQFPSGLDPAHAVDLLLSRAVFDVGAVTDFARLAIPFRCVAADLRAGEEVILRDGSLVAALRATMAMPGLFTPVERDGRLLVDGGILNNVPADVVRAMGADVVIAVDVGLPVDPKAKIGSVVTVLLRTVDVLTAVKNQRGIREADILIRPDLAGYTLQDWRSLVPLARRGRDAAESLAGPLRDLSLDEAAWRAHLAARRARRTPVAAPFTPRFVEVAPTAPPREARALLDRFAPVVGEPLDRDELEDELTRVTGEGRFAAIGYEPVVRDDGALGLRLIPHPKPYESPFANFLLDIGDGDGGRLSATLAGRLTFLDPGGLPGSEARVDAAVGDATRLSGEFLLPLSRLRIGAVGPAFVAPRLFAQRTNQNLYQRGDRVADYRVTETGVGLDIGTFIGRTDELRLGAEVSRLKASALVGDAAPGEAASGRYGALRLRWTHDSQDDGVLPTRGLYAQSELRRVVRAPETDAPFYRAEAAATWFVPAWEKQSLFVRVEGGTTFGATPPTALEFTLGGLLRLSALAPGELRGGRFAYGAAGVLWRLREGGTPLTPRTAVGVWLEAGSVSGGTSPRDDRATTRVNLSGGFVADTRYLGPVFVGGSVGGDDQTLLFSVGRMFRQ
ncbi:MAG TPA: patatin-like phospholipase family protein [Armatimonadaceae bacterium]|nr:patatin-like phospholipase family protein [Armatimonadaceae bacterium]